MEKSLTEKMSKYKECGTHEKRSSDELQRLCESCSRHYYLCEMCRTVKKYDAPPSICIKCAPAMKTLKTVLDRKDSTIHELSEKVKRYEQENKGHAELNESLRRQHGQLRRQHEESKINMKMYKDEYFDLKKKLDDLNKKHELLVNETKSKDKFIQDIKKLLVNQIFNDLTINVGNEVYSAHKCILAVRSEKLKKLLEPVIDPADKKHQRKLDVNNLQFTDVSENVMPIFIDYLYSGQLDKKITNENVGEIIKIAEKFEIDDLKEVALNFMEQEINRSTVIQILVQASHFNNENLKNKCIDFINREAIDLIDSPQWLAVKRDNPGAALDVYEARMKSMNYLESSSITKDSSTKGGSYKENQQLNYASSHNIGDIKTPRKPVDVTRISNKGSLKNLDNV